MSFIAWLKKNVKKDSTLRDVAKKIRRKMESERFIEQIDEKIIKLCDISIKEARSRLGIIQEISAFSEGIAPESVTDLGKLEFLHKQAVALKRKLEKAKEEEHDSERTAGKMSQLVKGDANLLQAFHSAIQGNKELFTELSDKVALYGDKESMAKLYGASNESISGIDTSSRIGKTVVSNINKLLRAKPLGIKGALETEAELLTLLIAQINRGFKKPDKDFKRMKEGKASSFPHDIASTAQELKGAFKVRIIRAQGITNKNTFEQIIEGEIGYLNNIKAAEEEKKQVMHKIYLILSTEVLLLREVDKEGLKWEGSKVMIYPAVNYAYDSRKFSSKETEEGSKAYNELKSKWNTWSNKQTWFSESRARIYPFYKANGRKDRISDRFPQDVPIMIGRYIHKYVSNSKKWPEYIPKNVISLAIEEEDEKQNRQLTSKINRRFTEIQKALRSNSYTNPQTKDIYDHVLEMEEAGSKGLSPTNLRMIANQFLTRPIGYARDDIHNLDLLNLLAYAVFFRENQEFLKTDTDTIRRIRHKFEPVDFVELADGLISEKYSIEFLRKKGIIVDVKKVKKKD